jgi:hypothetical protein
MATYPQTGSILTTNGHDSTRTGLSTSIVIRAGRNTVGAIQTLQVNEERTITMVDEVGTDGHIDSAPTRSTNITGSCERIRFDQARVATAFGRDFIHVHAQRIPFDIDIYDSWFGDASTGNLITTTIVNVWIRSIGYAYRADNWIIIDNMQWEAETIFSKLGNNANASTPGPRGLLLDLNPIELAADRGDRRGSLDAPDLLDDFFTNV